MTASVAESTTITTMPRQRGPIVALLAGNVVSIVGNMLTMVALPWFVLETTGSAAQTGLVGFFTALPGFIVGIFGGALVDRLGYKRVSVVSDLVSGFGVVMIPLLYLTIGIEFWQLLVLVFFGALLDIPGLTARRAMLPELTKQAGLRPEQVNSAFEGVQYLALLVGPPLAGVLIGWMGPSNVLWLDAGTFAISAACIAFGVPGRIRRLEAARGGRYIDDLKSGLRFLRTERVLFALAISLAVTNFFGSALFAIVLPVFAKDIYDSATALGVIASAFGAGSLIGATIYGVVGHRLPRRAMWVGGYTLITAVPLTMLLTTSLPIIVAVTVVCGVAGGPLNPLLVTVRHERIPEGLRGRVFATFSAISQVASPLGVVLAGFGIEHLSLAAVLGVMAVNYLVIGLAMFLAPAFRELDATKPVVGSEAGG